MKRAIAFGALGAFVAVLLLSSTAAGAPAPSPWCLPPESGQRLKTVVESDGFRSTLQETFVLEHADIQGAGVFLEIRDSAGGFARARLEPARPEPAAGRWFEFVAQESSSPQAAAILELATRRIEGGFLDNPYVPCHGSRRSEGVFRWWYLLCGAAQWLLIALGLAAAFRQPPLEARRN